MKQTQSSTTHLKMLIIVSLAVLFLFCGTVSAGTIFINTTGLSGNEGTTTQVPVEVSDADSLHIVELQFDIGTTAEYSVFFNETSIKKAGFLFNQTTGRAGKFNIGFTGDRTLFTLDVTPHVKKDIYLPVTILSVAEGTIDGFVPVYDYTATGATLLVEGSTPTPPPEDTDPPGVPSEPPAEDPPVVPSQPPSSSNGNGGGGSPSTSVTPTPTPTPTETTPLPTVTETPTATATETPDPTPGDVVPTEIPTTVQPPTNTGNSMLIPGIIAVLVVLAGCIIIVIVLKRRKDKEN